LMDSHLSHFLLPASVTQFLDQFLPSLPPYLQAKSSVEFLST